MKDFLEQTAIRNSLKVKLLSTRDKLIYVVRKRKLAQESTKSKIEVLLIMWDREVNAMAMLAIKSKDKKQRGLVADLNMIKDEVKLALLKTYLYLCSIRQSLAFFQWREGKNSTSNVRTKGDDYMFREIP